MKHLLIVLASLAGAIVLGGCSSSVGPLAGPLSPAFDPFGTEPPPPTGYEPTGGGNETPVAKTIAQLCAIACARIQSVCPGSVGGTDCAADCAASAAELPGCGAEFRTFVGCIATAPLTCGGSDVAAPSCEGAAMALDTCAG